MRIEDAVEADLPEIVDIYNDVIATSTAIFSDQPVTVVDRQEWMRERRLQGYPVLVAREQDTVVGFASYGDFRSSPGYRSSVEHSVHVAARCRRQGIGRHLVAALLDRARDSGKHVVIAGIDADNEASLQLHAKLGFVEVGRMPQIARKFDRWVELVLMQLTL